jgi:hypothetical protein
MIDLAAPVLEPMDIWHLLHNCEKVNRFGGRGKGTVSVLRHSLLVSDLCDDPIARRWAILHDLHESPYGEIPTPGKRVIGEFEISRATGKFDQALLTAAGLEVTADALAEVKAADTLAMMIEKDYLGIDPGDDWGTGIHEISSEHTKRFELIKNAATRVVVCSAVFALWPDCRPYDVEYARMAA